MSVIKKNIDGTLQICFHMLLMEGHNCGKLS
jgi:hypothetical protein